MDDEEYEEYLYNLAKITQGEHVAELMFDDECFTIYDFSNLEVIANVDWFGED